MIEIKNDPASIWQEYQSLTSYLTENDIYSIVKKNEKFYDGRQWDGAKADAIAKPTMNRLQRIGKYQIATLSTNDIGISIKSQLGNEAMDRNLEIISNEVKNVIEIAKMKEQTRLMVRYGYVDGASYMLETFEPDYDTGQESKGIIESQIVDMTQVYFGNPYSAVIQKQPFIIIALRQYVKQVQDEAHELGVANWEDITSDTDDNYDEDTNGKLCTVLLKFYRKRHTADDGREIKTIFFTKSTKDVMIVEETDLGYTRYPIARFGWENRRNSYLFDSPMTSNIVNQVFINKCYAYAHEYALKQAFPKRIYDQTKIDIQDWDASGTLGVAGIDLTGKLLDFSQMPDFSNQILNLIEQTGLEMEKNMGVNDAALGNVKPDNASAIIAMQEAATVPLEIQRQNYYEMWEDIIRNTIDIMICSYGVRLMPVEDGEPMYVDFTLLRGLNYRLTIDIGSAAQYSEIAQMNTLSALLQSGQIDLELFAKVCPDKYLPNRTEILKYCEERKRMEQQAAMMQQTMQR